jgi:hypothetical protein
VNSLPKQENDLFNVKELVATDPQVDLEQFSNFDLRANALQDEPVFNSDEFYREFQQSPDFD